VTGSSVNFRRTSSRDQPEGSTAAQNLQEGKTGNVDLTGYLVTASKVYLLRIVTSRIADVNKNHGKQKQEKGDGGVKKEGKIQKRREFVGKRGG